MGDSAAWTQRLRAIPSDIWSDSRVANYDWDWDAALLYVGATKTNGPDGVRQYRPNLLPALNGQGGFGYYQPGVAAVNNNPGVYNLSRRS